VYEVLASAHGFGNFLAYQVLVDLLYPLDAFGGKPLLLYSHDDWSAAGPGAQRGIGMLLAPGVKVEHLAVMRWLREHQRAEFARLGLRFPFLTERDGRERELSLANIQNCLCEFHKFIKISEGTGRGRRKFAPANQPHVVQLPLAFTAAAQDERADEGRASDVGREGGGEQRVAASPRHSQGPAHGGEEQA
jgi:hypothetical protein